MTTSRRLPAARAATSPAANGTRPPPTSSSEAERGVVGAALNHGYLAGALLAVAPSELFYDQTLKAAAEAIEDLVAAGEEVEPLSVGRQLQRRGRDTPTTADLTALMLDAPIGDGTAYRLAEEVADRHRRRQWESVAGELVEAAHNLGQPLEESAAALLERLPIPAGADPVALAFRRRVDAEADRLRVADAARRQLTPRAARPPLLSLPAFLAEPDPEAVYRIDQLLTVGGRAVLTAPKKAGKTTAVGNLLRSLADAEPFLGAFQAAQVDRVVLLDDEHDPRTLRRWLRDQQIGNPERVDLVSLRGALSSFDLLDASARSEWAQALAGADFVVFDCLRPVLDALGLDEAHDAGRFLAAFDELLREAGVGEALVVHHMGHNGERARGDSRIRDWPDVEWRVVQQRPEDGTEDPDAPRYFAAYGRDVNVPEGRLDYDAATRRLSLAGGSRRDAELDRAKAVVLEAVRKNPGMTGRGLESAADTAGVSRNAGRKARQALIREGQVRTEEGPKNSTLHYPAEPPK